MPGDRIGVAFDSITRRIWFSKNGVWQGSPGVAPVGTATISIANPAVITRTAHGLAEGEQVFFTTMNTLPAAITANARYYVRNATSNTFNISATPAGDLISTVGNSQSGTHTVHHGVGTGSALTLPAGEYYPMIWLSDRDEYTSWRKIGYITTAFATFSPNGAKFNQQYPPPSGFTAFASY